MQSAGANTQTAVAAPINQKNLRVAGAIAATGPICPLCQGDDNRKAFTDNGCELRDCNRCGLFFVHPYPRTRDRHAQIAAGDLQGIELLDCGRRYEGERLYYNRHFSAIAAECRGARSLLDVGCGTGHLLERFSENRSIRRIGIELNRHAAQFARRVADCEIAEIPFEDFQTNERFDVITLINVFSHVQSLDSLFLKLRSLLAPGGKVILRTSEMSRRVSRWNQLHWGIPDDLHFLGLDTLDFLCCRYGFKVVRHIRAPYEEELFRPSRWQQMGRSAAVNTIKRAGIAFPGALTGMRQVYKAAFGERLYVSLIVLTPTSAAEGAAEAREIRG